MSGLLLWLATLLGASGVIAGAIGSHIVENGSSAFEIGVRYQLIHAAAIFVIAVVPERVNRWSGMFFLYAYYCLAAVCTGSHGVVRFGLGR